MREQATVALSDDGGDIHYTAFIPIVCYRELSVTKGLGLRLSALMRDDIHGHHEFFSEDGKPKLYTPEFASHVAARDSGDFLRELFRRGSQLEPMNRLGYVDLYLDLARMETPDSQCLVTT